MYLYLNSQDSINSYPDNTPANFTCQFSRSLNTKNTSLGLCELIVDIGEDVFAQKYDVSANTAYLMVSECANSEVGGHNHPVVRMFSLRDFSLKSKSVLRFEKIIYVPLKEYITPSVTVKIIQVDECCVDKPSVKLPLKGITRCTFHLKKDLYYRI